MSVTTTSSASIDFITNQRESLFKEFLVFHAASTGDLTLLQQLIASGTPLEITDYDKRTPLHIAVCGDKLEIVECLCEAKVTINPRDRWGNTPLQNAISQRSYRSIQYLKSRGGELAKNGELIQALADATVNGDIEQLGLLLQAGASVNTPDFEGRTVLHKAACAGVYKSVQFLVQHGAKLNVKDKWGRIPLDYAKEIKSRSITHLLSHSFSTADNTTPPEPSTPRESSIFSFLNFGAEKSQNTPNTSTVKNAKQLEAEKQLRRISRKKSHKLPVAIEQLAREEVETRLIFNGEINKTSSSSIFEQFFIVGATDSEDPAVIFKYPDQSKMDIPGLADFCFPCGRNSALVPKTTSSAASSSNPPQVIHSNNPQNSFIFVITNKTGQYLYCIAVIDDVLQNIPSFVTNENVNPSIKKLCYCIITPYPIYQPFFKLLYSILDTLFYQSMINTPNSSNETSPVIAMLKEVYEQKVPVPGEMLRIVNSKLKMPLLEEEYLQISQFTGDIVFEFLSEKKFIWVLCAILSEYKILFIHSSVRKLSSIVLSFISLLYPLKYQFSIIPILPNKMVSILDAPCPFLAGMVSRNPLKNIDIPEDLIIVDLEDTARVNLIPDKPVLYELPNQNRFIETLNYFYSKKAVRKSQNTANQNNNLLSPQVNVYIGSLLAIKKYCITDLTRDVTVFWAENFMEQQSPENVPFYKQFVNSQMFSSYIDRYLREYDRKRRSSKVTDKKET